MLPSRHHWLLGLTVLAILLALSEPSYATDHGLRISSALSNITQIATGLWARFVLICGIVISGVTLAYSDVSTGGRAAIKVILGVSVMAFGGGILANWMGIAQGVQF